MTKVEDWLKSQLAVDIWNKKYRFENESFDQWLDRVSGGNKAIKKLILDKKFLFGGRILANRGLNNGSLSNCFRKGTRVVTRDGVKPIEDVCVGDLVLTHQGRYMRVVNTLSRDYAGDMYAIKPKYGETIYCTSEHPFLTAEGTWKKAEELVVGKDKLTSVKNMDALFDMGHTISFVPKTLPADETFVDEGDKFRIKKSFTNTRYGKEYKSWTIKGHSVKKECIVDSEIAYFIGRWLGDGSVTLTPKRNSGVLQIVFNQSTEEDAALYCAKIGERFFGFKPNIRYTEQNVIALRFENRHICNTFIELFGKGCADKRIPSWLMGNPYVLAGLYDSDGVVSDSFGLRIDLKNKGLIEDIRDSQLMIGVAYSKIKETTTKLNGKTYYAYELTTPSSEAYVLRNCMFKKPNAVRKNTSGINEIPIKNITKEYSEEKVYNLSVEEDESYVVDGKVVHNCYVLSVDDSIESIYNTARDMALTYKAGGGVGIDISSLAPNGAKVNNPAKTSSGAISFIDLFTTTTGLIGQSGRRGALMISISCDHPDIDEFIKLKTDVNKATTANLSIRVTNDFMKAVENDEDWFCAFTREETGECISKTFKARDLFKLFCDANYDYGEPGLLYWDEIERYNMLNKYPDFKFAGVNPCAEESLPDGGACLLGSINLSEYVKGTSFDFKSFEQDVAICIGALDEVLTEGIDLHPLEIQKEMARSWRQVGLGIMGLGDMLIKMNIRYGSKESLELCDAIGRSLATSSIKESMILGEKLGSFPKFKQQFTEKSSFYSIHMNEQPCGAMRNSQLLCIAPTGTISTMLGISGGIEPLFALEYDRTTKSLHGEDMKYKVIPDIVAYARERGLDKGLVCAQDIDYTERIAMQEIWQRHIDSSISSTVNLPKDFPKENIGDLYMLAWKSGLKGVTVFRDGCKREGILTTKTDEVIDDELIGYKRKIVTGCGNQHICVYADKSGNLKELFCIRGSSGGCLNTLNGLSRMVSLSLRNNVPLDAIVDQLLSCGVCSSYATRRATHKDVSKGTCCPSAIAYALMDIRDSIKKDVQSAEHRDTSPKCPECGSALSSTNGCVVCVSCGYSRCG